MTCDRASYQTGGLVVFLLRDRGVARPRAVAAPALLLLLLLPPPPLPLLPNAPLPVSRARDLRWRRCAGEFFEVFADVPVGPVGVSSSEEVDGRAATSEENI